MSHLLVFQGPAQFPCPHPSSTEQEIRSPHGGQWDQWANGDTCAPRGPPDEGARLLSALVRVEPGAEAPEPLGGQQAMSHCPRAPEALHELR